ncbi:MAG: glycosyltransferase family 2 protein [Pseudorhodobacter sp.]|nr:glycosyltransferase family 2 protein [Pseudorhodobacter sp.]
MPKLTCITTTFNDSTTALTAIESVLTQSFGDFQYLIVDDGSTDDTPCVLQSLTDPRIQVIRQANDGLSSARNKAFPHIKGDYVCFLDSDDIRPNWAFAAIAEAIDRDQSDLILCRGNLSEVRGDFSGFYDDGVFFQLETLCPDNHVSRRSTDFAHARPLMQRIEPQSANKAVRTEFLRKSGVTFPNGHFFEDMFFHTALLSEAASVSFVNAPCFTYFRRYLRAQITATAGDRRFDAIAVTKLTLERFSRSLEFHDAATRAAVLTSCLRIVSWCGESISHQHRGTFRQTVRAMLMSIDPLYLNFPPNLPVDVGPLDQIQHYVRDLLDAA